MADFTSPKILVTGGARSGKSAFAEQRVKQMGAQAVYIATAQALDTEMEARIAAHRKQRGDGWQLIEAPQDLVPALRSTDGQGAPRLVDCLTLWLSNLMLAEQDWEGALEGLCAALPGLLDPVVFVTNEVGAGIVPENKLARQYRDAAGLMNQRVAAACAEVWLVASGCPLQIKG